MNRPNECHIGVSESGRRRRACGMCTKSKRRCSLVDNARQSRTPSATPSARKRSSSRPQTPKSKPKANTPSTTKKATASKAKTSKAGPSRSSSQAAKSWVPNTLSKSTLSWTINISLILSDNNSFSYNRNSSFQRFDVDFSIAHGRRRAQANNGTHSAGHTDSTRPPRQHGTVFGATGKRNQKTTEAGQ